MIIKDNQNSKDCKKISVKNLSISYQTSRGLITAAENISFDLSEGESIGIIGESGSGKSTIGLGLIRSLPENGFVNSGYFEIRGKNVLEIPLEEFDRRYRWKEISMIFQGSMNSLDPVFTIENQMKEILTVHKKKDKKNFSNWIRELLNDVGLDPDLVIKRYPHELSGGMKQRVVIANALILESSVLIADEPTTALDVIVQSQIINLLKNFKKTKKMNIIIITHDLSLIPTLVDRVLIMYAGQAVEISDVKSILTKPLHPYTQALIKSIPKIKAGDKIIHFIKGDPPNLLNIKDGCRFKDRCPEAMNICKNNPPDIQIGNNMVKCWLYADKRTKE